MLPGMIKIDDLHGTRKMQIGQIPDPDGPVADNDFDDGPLPTSAPGLGINAEIKLFSGFDSTHIRCGIRVADGPSILICGGLGVYGAEFAFTCAGTLSVCPSGTAFGCGSDSGDLNAVHQHVHDRNILPGNSRQEE